MFVLFQNGKIQRQPFENAWAQSEIKPSDTNILLQTDKIHFIFLRENIGDFNSRKELFLYRYISSQKYNIHDFYLNDFCIRLWYTYLK